MVTDVAHVGSAQQGVANGMDEHIGIAVAQQSLVVVEAYATQPQRTAFYQLVDVVSETYTYFHLFAAFGRLKIEN
jgi:hypothetical protein